MWLIGHNEFNQSANCVSADNQYSINTSICFGILEWGG